jgi:acetyl-CoA carboxylase biotin carboxyl carrier protein
MDLSPDRRADWGAGEPAGPERGAWSVMDFDDIERILALVREHELAEFELEREGLKLRVRKAVGPYHHMVTETAAPPPSIPAPVPPAASAVPVAPVSSTPTDLEPDVELAVVKSPIVGTFYRSSEPGAPPFVDVGERVKKDQVLCIIEAMKLMNEITSEYEGEIVSVYVENGKPVQYGERLFAIKTS